MAVINFTIPIRLEANVKKAIRKNGFVSKAEFFRMAAVNYLRQELQDKDRTQFLIQAIADELATKYRGRKIPPVEEQLKDILK